MNHFSYPVPFKNKINMNIKIYAYQHKKKF
jgi:hypothetical protein